MLFGVFGESLSRVEAEVNGKKSQVIRVSGCQTWRSAGDMRGERTRGAGCVQLACSHRPLASFRSVFATCYFAGLSLRLEGGDHTTTLLGTESA